MTAIEVVRALGTSAVRRAILRGLLAYRSDLRRIGVKRAFQWLDGSFAERLDREPNDVDVVTFAHTLPVASSLGPADRDVLDRTKVKATHHCDAYFVSLRSALLVDVTTYWYGLFSHRRGSLEWKGMLRVALDDVADDAAALKELERLDGSGPLGP